jgi:glycerol-3-phosphate acyltransferase PlsY
MRTTLWALAAFVAGTIPSPYVLARLAGRRDVIAEMTRHPSTGDAHFLLAKKVSMKLGVIAAIIDMLKGFVPALLARLSDQNASTIAWVGVAALAGHMYAPFLRAYGGRGLTTTAGVALAVTPKAMVATGLISLAGIIFRAGGLGTSIGFALMAVFAGLFGYPAAFVWMAAAMFVLIAARRLEGIGADRRGGVSFGKAILGRVLFDLPDGRRS